LFPNVPVVVIYLISNGIKTQVSRQKNYSLDYSGTKALRDSGTSIKTASTKY